MKKIYMLMAALSLLTLSLNAQVILEKNPAASTSSQMSKAPQRIDLPANQYLVGPYTTDDMDASGIGARSLGTSGGYNVSVGVLLNPEDFQNYLGGDVVAFRAGFSQENDVVNYYIYQVKVDGDGTVTFGASQSIPASTTANYSTHDAGWVTTYVADNSSTPMELKLDNGYTHLLIGYTYIQYYDTDYAYPIGVNSNSTTHPFYLYYQNQWVAQTSITADMAMQLIVEMPEKTATPVINYTINDDGSTVTITVNEEDYEDGAEIHMYVDGNEVPFPYTVGRGSQDYDLVVTATAKEDGKLISDVAQSTITIPLTQIEITAEPDVIPTTHDINVELNSVGDGEVHMYVDGREVPSPWYLERLEQEYTVIVRVTAQEEGKAMSTHYETITVPARGPIDLTGWTELPGTYNANEVINWGKHVMFLDRFTASTALNKQPLKYDYVLVEQKPEDVRQKTNSVTVPVLATGSVINGYYTEEDVANDKDRHMELNLMNGDFEMKLEPNGDIYYYTMDRSVNSKADADYIELTKPQHNINDTYTEMGSYFHEEPFTFNAGIKHRLDTVGSKYYYGEYGNQNKYMTYIPIVWSFGNLENNKRTNFDVDKKHNSYGSPIWQTGVGSVEVNANQSDIQRQNGKWATWTYEENGVTKNACTYRAHISAYGYLPQDGNSEVNVEYEPYMFRIWVQCDGMRNYEVDPATGKLVDAGPCTETTKWLVDVPCELVDPVNEVYSQRLDYGDIDEQDAYDNQLIFGADATAKPSFIVRFYYRTKVKDIVVPEEPEDPNEPTTDDANMLRAKNRDGENYGRYYAAEGGYSEEPSTDVAEFYYHGEVESQIFYNVQGMQSDKPFNGINIVVTRYSDGTTTTTKVVR